MNFRRPRTRSRKNSMNVILNTEKWRHYGKRLSKRTDELPEDSDNDDDDEPKYNEIKDWVEEFFEKKNESVDKYDQDVEVQLTRKQTLILSTLVPDELLLIDKFNTTDPKRFVGVLLMADVSGYTALSERYNNTGKGGTYRLTATLNTYLGSLIELIYSHGGDIIKFAGDAFLALWKTDKRTFLCHTIHTVIACALIIQHSYSSYETDVKVNLKVKLAISAGNLIFTPIGTGIDMNYILIGLPVLEAKAAESLCSSGEVKLTPTAWGHCYSRNYDHVIQDNGHVTIKAILYDPHESDVTKPFVGFGSMIRQYKKQFTSIETLPNTFWDTSKTLNIAEAFKTNDIFDLRKTILLAEEKNIGSEIRKFMIRPVLTQIDAHQPLEYLIEMRLVSVLFITLKPRECPFPQLITIVNNAYQITCEIVYKSMGCVNKIILFDKDIMILVIFGLRGFKHESEAQAALKCACSIKKSVAALDGVLEVSIGVTTGQVYCGVVGHPLRREFTVIGAIVNKAARLMCSFRHKITCDETTFVKSKMSSNGFTLQPKTELKGIVHPGNIYEYTEEIRIKEMYDIPLIQPLLNRTDEMEYYENWLDDSHLAYRDFDALLLVGESRIGKSRLLEWMARYAQNRGYHICYINLTSIHSATSYLALSQIFNQILNLKEPITGFTKEEKIVELLKVYNEDLCYLNKIIRVRFAYHDGVQSLDDQKRKEKAKYVFIKLIMSIIDTHVIFLDDLQNLDSSSWEFISLMFNSMKIFTVISVTRGKFGPVHNWLYNVFINDNIRKMVLGPLASTWIPALACQILDVNAVPYDLCKALKNKCKGMPGLVESFIIHLFSSGALELKKIYKTEINNWESENLQFPSSELLHPQALNTKHQAVLDKLIIDNITEDVQICIVTQKEELKTNINVQNLDALIMIQIDSLTPYQQLLLKIASVIGNVISRDLLENIMYENNPLTTAKAVKRLFSMRILSCANVVNNKWYRQATSTITVSSNLSGHGNLMCECCFDYNPENNENLPKYSFCKVMKFRNKNSRKTCYELLPLNQKKEFHTRIVNYLEGNKQRCPNCGGTIMVVQSMLSINPDDSFSNRDSANTILITQDNLDCESQSFDPESLNNKPQTSTNNTVIAGNFKTSNSEFIKNSKAHITVPGTDIGILPIHNPSQSLPSKKGSVVCPPILKAKNSTEDSVKGRRSTKRVTMTNFDVKKSSSDVISCHKIFDMLRAVTEAESISDWHNLGAVDSEDCIVTEGNGKNSASFSMHIEKGVSLTDFNKCTCAELNIMIYDQLIYHAQQAELKSKAITFLIQYSHLNLLSNNFDVFQHLQDAENICHENSDTVNELDKKRFLGKIYCLKAAAYLMSGKLTPAKLEIERASRIYRMDLHKVSDFFNLKRLVNFIKIRRRKYRLHEILMKNDSVFYLKVATLLYSALGEDNISKCAAYKALNIVQRVECSLVDTCDVYSNAIQVELDRGIPEATAEIERLAILSLKKLKSAVQANELYAIGRLFSSTFRARMARGQLAATVRSGFRALAVSRFLQANNVSLDIIPDLFYILLSRRRIAEAVDVTQLLLRFSQRMLSFDSETWYYALCMDMILDAGFQLESPDEISHFAEYSLDSGKSAGPSRRRLVVGLWTYWLRTNYDKKAKRFESEALSWASNEDDDGCMTTLISALRLAEGMLESLATKVDDLRKVVDLMELRSIADRELTKLETDARNLRALYPRWILLKANSLKLSGRRLAANTLFNQALEESCRIHNRLEESLIKAALSDSVFWVQSARAGGFINWRDGAEHARSSWHQLMYKITTRRS